MIDEPRVDVYRRIVEEETQRNEDIDDIARQIEDLRRQRQTGRNNVDRQEWQGEGQSMAGMTEAHLDHGESLESDPFAELTERELEELDLAPDEIDFTALSPEQQVRYWSLLSPGEKLYMVRLHLQR